MTNKEECSHEKCLSDGCVVCCKCSEQLKTTCCVLRRKILVIVAKVFSEEESGIPDSEMADVIRFDLESPSGNPVIGFRFCPWCGKKRGGEVRITDVTGN